MKSWAETSCCLIKSGVGSSFLAHSQEFQRLCALAFNVDEGEVSMVPPPVPGDQGSERCSPPCRATGQKSQEWSVIS